MKYLLGLLWLIFIGFSCVDKRNEVEVNVKENIAQQEYYGYDTILLDKYESSSGHEINLEGSNSKDVYRIRVNTKDSRQKIFQIAENWYTASHSKILWDNENYIFIRYGCGTNCWGGKLLSLKEEEEIVVYPNYIFSDGTMNIIVYEGKEYGQLVIEDFSKKRKQEIDVKICPKSSDYRNMIDTVYVDEMNLLKIKHYNLDCEKIIETEINIKELKK